MAYVPPTAAQVKARYSEFTPVSDDLINLVIADAMLTVNESWLERDYQRAIMLLVCHMLALEGEPGRSNGAGGAASTGAVKRVRVGDVETEFASAGASSGGSVASGFGLTTYGQQYLALLRLNFAGPVAV